MRLVEVRADDERQINCQRAYFAEISIRFGVEFDPYAGENEDLSETRQWHVVVLENDDKMGCGSLRDLGMNLAEVKRVWVSPAVRGKGVAGLIMDWLEKKAEEHGFSAIRLDTNKTLNEAQAMYRKRGYYEINRYNDNPFAHHFYEKKLQD